MPDAPRLLTRARLRQYLGDLPWADIARRIERGKLPAPLWGLPAEDRNARWDVRAVDQALDVESGPLGSLERDIAILDRHFGLR